MLSLRQQAITQVNVDPDLCHHMASLGRYGFMRNAEGVKSYPDRWLFWIDIDCYWHNTDILNWCIIHINIRVKDKFKYWVDGSHRCNDPERVQIDDTFLSVTVFYLKFLWHPSECPFRTSNTHSSYMISTFFTRPKHDFTRLGRVDGWLGRTLSSMDSNY